MFRFFAWLLDLLIVLTGELALILAVSFLDHNMMQWFGLSHPQKIAVINILRWPVGLLLVVWPWLYTTSLETSEKKATYGKYLFDMQVTDRAGKRLTFWRSSARYWAKFLSTVFLFAGYFPALFNEKRLTFHDILCGTRVDMTGRNLDRDEL